MQMDEDGLEGGLVNAERIEPRSKTELCGICGVSGGGAGPMGEMMGVVRCFLCGRDCL